MSLAKYEVFKTIVDLGSLTRAAETLNLTQSGVSHAISSLESEFGFSLLTRDRSGIGLTSNGERILEYIRKILQTNEGMIQEVAAIKGLMVGTVRIGSFSSVSTLWLPGIIKEFQNKYPAIEIQLLEGNYDDLNHWVSTGTVDFGFLSLPVTKAVEVIPLKKDKMVCILPGNHPLSNEKSLSFDQIKEEPFIMPKWGRDHDIRRILHENKITPRIRYEVVEDQAIISMVENGLGISILTEMVINRLPSNAKVVNLEKPYYRTIGIAGHSFKNISPGAKRFIDCIQGWLKEQNLLDFAN